MSKDNSEIVKLSVSEDILINDGNAQLVLVKADQLEIHERVFCISAVDAGGFTGVYLTPENWLAMKNKIDAYVATLPEAV